MSGGVAAQLSYIRREEVRRAAALWEHFDRQCSELKGNLLLAGSEEAVCRRPCLIWSPTCPLVWKTLGLWCLSHSPNFSFTPIFLLLSPFLGDWHLSRFVLHCSVWAFREIYAALCFMKQVHTHTCVCVCLSLVNRRVLGYDAFMWPTSADNSVPVVHVHRFTVVPPLFALL